MKKTENNSRDWNWSDYFDAVIDPPMRETLKTALDNLGQGEGRQAVDLGCGAGNDAIHILNAGFKLLAIDSSEDGLIRLNKRFKNDGLETRLARFEDADLPESILINASFSLPFCDVDDFKTVWLRIEGMLESDGIFAGHLFGVEDSWNGRVADMNFHTEQQVESLVQGFEVLHFYEEKKSGTDALGRAKFWHIFHIVLRKR